MASNFGVTPTGFKPMAFPDVQADLQTALQASFGSNINLDVKSVYGQFVGIMSERLTLLWQLGQVLYNANNPVAATGTSLDNIAALNGLTRQSAKPTVTAPLPVQSSNGVTLYGLVLFGTPGTIIPAGSIISDGLAVPDNFTLDATVTIGAASNARQTVLFSNQPGQGTYSLTLTDAAGDQLTTPLFTYGLPVQDPTLAIGTAAQGTFTLTLAQSASVSATTVAISTAASAAQIQQAVASLAGYSAVAVSQVSPGNLAVHFPGGPTPLIQVNGNSGVIATNSVEGAINTLALPSGAQPFTDVLASQITNGIQFDFGGGTVASGQTGTGSASIPLVSVSSNTLNASGNVTNISVLESRVGAPAQGVGSATSQATGPVQISAGALTTIVTPTSGWSGVNNQLDCITGANTETDAQLLARIQSVRAGQGSTSLAAIVERVRAVSGVTASIGFQNNTSAAQQIVAFNNSPTSGSFQLATTTGATSALSWNATALQVQSALAALPEYAAVKVTGTASYGYVVDFNGSQGGQAQPLLNVLNNSTGVGATVNYGRPPHSVEIVVAGGTDTDVGNAILAALPAGMATYGAPVVNTTGTVAAGSTQLTLSSALGAAAGLNISMPGVALGSTVTSVANNVLNMSSAALSTQNNANCILNHAPLLVDSAGNSQVVAFSRPTPILIYIAIQLVTDQFNVPGQPSSGLNAASQWSPASVATIQNNLLAIGNAVPIGGTIVSQGTNGLVGCFNAVAGIVSYTLAFDAQPNPSNTSNLSLQPSQAPTFEAANVNISYT